MNRTLVGIGDSITHGTCSEHEFGLVKNNFIDIVAKELAFDKVINYGVNGTCICPQCAWRPTLAMCEYVKEFYPADMAIIAGGTNDYGNNIEIGQITDKDNKTFFGALDVLFEEAKKRYNEVYVLTPINRLNMQKKNGCGYVLDDYRNAIEVKAKQFNFNVIKGQDIEIYPDDEKERNKYIKDGLHPNQTGHEIIAKHILRNIKNGK